MSEKELAGQLFGQGQEQPSMGAWQAIKEAFATLMPGLDKDKIAADLGKEATHQIGAGAHELAAALFSPSNSGFVMYPRGTKDDHQREGQQQEQQGQQQDGHGVHGPEQQRDQP